MKASHPQNQYLADMVTIAAEERGLEVRHNVTSYSNFAGVHRYVLLRPGVSRDYSIRSRGMITYTGTPFSRNYLPSIKGERDALTRLLMEIRSL